MRTALQLVHRGSEPLDLVEAPVGPPVAGAWIARMDTALVCASDLHTLAGRRTGPTPCILGHETVARLEVPGAGAPDVDLDGTPLRCGDRVVWSVATSCGACPRCAMGLPQKCRSSVKYGHATLTPEAPWSGGFAQYQHLVPGTSLLRVPDEVPSRWAAMVACTSATVAAALRAAGSVRGKTVLVNGGGNLGAQAVLHAVDGGATHVLCIEPNPLRRTAVASLGARCFAPGDLRPEFVPEAGIDVVFELAGHVEDFEGLLRTMAIGATMVLAGAVFSAPPVPLDMETVIRKCLRIHGIHNYAPGDLALAMEGMRRHWRALESVLNIAEPLPLERHMEVLEHARSGLYQRAGFHGLS